MKWKCVTHMASTGTETSPSSFQPSQEWAKANYGKFANCGVIFYPAFASRQLLLLLMFKIHSLASCHKERGRLGAFRPKHFWALPVRNFLKGSAWPRTTSFWGFSFFSACMFTINRNTAGMCWTILHNSLRTKRFDVDTLLCRLARPTRTYVGQSCIRVKVTVIFFYLTGNGCNRGYNTVGPLWAPFYCFSVISLLLWTAVYFIVSPALKSPHPHQFSPISPRAENKHCPMAFDKYKD